MRTLLKSYAGASEVSAALDALLRDYLTTPRGKAYLVILSGGRTPLPAYRRLADYPVEAARQAHVVMSDERHVPPDDAANNAAQFDSARRACGIDDARFLRVDTTRRLADAAKRFDRELRERLQDGMLLPLAVLGIGADGHTASLFNDGDLRRAKNHLAIAVRRPTHPHRISMTPELLGRVERVIVPVTDVSKSAVTQALLRKPDTLVCGKALRGVRRLEIWAAREVLCW